MAKAAQAAQPNNQETVFVERVIRLDDYRPHPRNYNKHPAAQIERLRLSLRKFGQPRNIVVWREFFVAGHGVAQAAMAEGWETLRANVIPDDWPEERALAFLAADNELSRLSDPDQAALAQILDETRHFDEELMRAIGYDDKEFEALLAAVGASAEAGAGDGAGAGGVDVEPQVDRAEELGAKWRAAEGQIWRIGEHVVICGDCREPDTWHRLLQAANVDRVNGVFTSPPYAMQRKDQYGGVPTAEYVDWWEAVQANVKANLAQDGSFFVNIKAHCEDGQRVLYCMDLVCSMVRRWGWKFIDENAWVHQGFPGMPQRRFQNAWEPIYHFVPGEPKFRPDNVAYESDSVIQYEQGLNLRQRQRATSELSAQNEVKHGKGKAYPRNVLKVSSAAADVPEHAAAFPVDLPDFFIRAYSDPGDVWVDPFLGSGTTIIAAHNNKRRGLGSEKLPKYMGVILERLAAHTNTQPELLA